MRRLGDGSWLTACRRAGVAPAGAPRAHSGQDPVAAVRAAAAGVGHALSRWGYRTWRAAQADPGRWPSLDRYSPAEWRSLCRRAGVGGAIGKPRQLLLDRDLVVALRRASAERGPLSVEGYADWRSDQAAKGVRVPSVATVLARFGSWDKACRAADLPGLKRYWSDEELLEALGAAAMGATRLTAREYITWARAGGGEERPGVATMMRRFGSWTRALEAAGIQPKP